MNPIKRHKALLEFSKDHHFGLLLCWKIRQGLARGIEPQRISSYILFFYEEDLKEHFREEEEKLFCRLDPSDPMRIEVEAQHNNIYRLVDEIRSQPGKVNLLEDFAKSLDDHIRYEERILFNHLQELMSPDDLLKASAHNSDSCRADDSIWKDQFWAVQQPGNN